MAVQTIPPRIRWAVDLMDVQPSDHVLEIGCGPGYGAEMICERLTDDPRIDASDVTVEVNQGVVRLTGGVDERRTKYQIEDLIERCGGVQDVDNQLRIRSSPLWSGAEASAGGSSGEARTSEGRSTSANKRA